MTGTMGQPVPRLWLETAASVLPDMARDMVRRICDEVPEYGMDATGVATAETRRAVREALGMFMRSMTWGGRGADASGSPGLDEHAADVFRRLGRREARAGRSHDTLQSAYRVASQAVMQNLLRWEREHDAPRETMAFLSTAVFDFVDELARFSAEGFADGQSARADDEHARTELLGLLVHRDGFARRQVTEAAARVGWPLPSGIAIAEIVCDVDGIGGTGGTVGTSVALGAQIFGKASIVGRVGDRVLAAVPAGSTVLDAEDLRRRVADAADEVGCDVLVVVGPEVPLVEAASSARLAHRLRSRHDVRTRAVAGVATCDDHLIDVTLDCGRDAARALVSSRLTPLTALTPAKRLKYARLLSAWLEYGTLSADEPGVLDKHRQTLRYQVNQLEKMFGAALHDRTARVELIIALRAVLPLWERQANNGVFRADATTKSGATA